ncbi:YutD family protein [Paenibacillus nasutitermitis]
MHINGRAYELIHENKDGWNPEAFRERFSEVLERYDYVIGDWGYNQLRLKGFFRDNHPKATKDSAFSSMLDYINEYCNFGCAYFVLQRHPGVKRQGEDGSEIESDESEHTELFEGIEDAYELSMLVGESGQVDETGQEVRAPRIVREHQRREYHPKHPRKDAAKDTEKEPFKENRKPFNKDRDKERDKDGGRQQSTSNHQEERSGNTERGNRHRKPHFTAPKAPVAAASETQSPPRSSQRERQRDSGPKS